MKRTRTVILGLLSIGVLLSTCQKSDFQNPPALSPHRIIVDSQNGGKALHYLLVTQIGHDGRNCKGCVLFEGKMIHKDCMGHGNYCLKAVSVSIDTLGECVTTTDTFGLTSEDFFSMPDRSLYFYTDESGNRIFLNIPEQLVYRDRTTLQFTFTGLSFTVGAVYSND